MRVIVHIPTDVDSLNKIQETAAQLHAEAVSNYIMRLSCPMEQKLQLLDSVKETVKNQK